eukprot:gnl/TRDRNA2_/TRDRNA2_57204_c0_seq1.p1 gnl/TRDRNA2_/TRDRNA2_57204_c0~~gnl/TRDRNA2_/TRDRNA2_57204_c0_seq1.p1  ORF type:complete len:276 (-),score=30.39 gnl/TRDRNA2_/TRDRNA2_57204_c0_seq1:63-890(-)
MRTACSVALLGLAAATASPAGPVVVTGATGRTGRLIYGLLKNQSIPVRALVRNQSKARELLDCGECEAAEGIFVGDIKKPSDLIAPMAGAGGLVIATSSWPICDPYPHCHFPADNMPIDVDWKGGKNQISAFATHGKGGPIALISTMGTTEPDTNTSLPAHISFYKLNLEADLMDMWPCHTIVKPCGLGNGAPGQQELVVGHDDTLATTTLVARADIARVMVASVLNPELSKGLRFDVCAQAGKPTPDAGLVDVLRKARYPWETSSSADPPPLFL